MLRPNVPGALRRENMPPISSLDKRISEPLVGRRFTIIPLKEEHICDMYVSWLNDPEINSFLEVRFVNQTRETVQEYVRSFYKYIEKYIWGIYPIDSEGMIGTATLSGIDRHHGLGEIGLVIGEKAYWGKGASEEAVNLVAEFAFEILGLRRLTGGCYASNYGMSFSFKRLGFTNEGKLRQAYYLSPGVYVDGYRWGLLDTEWRVGNRKRKVQGE